MVDTSALQSLLVYQSVFKGMSKSQIAWMLQASELQDFKKGEVLFERGQVLSDLFVLLTGHVKLTIPANDGERKVVALLNPGDVFGESSLVPGSTSLVKAQALDNGSMFRICVKDLGATVDRVSGLNLWLLSRLGIRIREHIHDIESVTYKSAAQRVAEYVLQQPRQGDETKLKFHKRTIASKLGLQPETLSRSLKQLVQDGLISVKGSRIKVHDEAALRALVT